MIAYGGDVVSEPERVHMPVLVREVCTHLTDGPSDAIAGWVIDGTLGAGGHTRALLETYPNIKIFGLDQDPEVLSIAQRDLVEFEGRVVFTRGRFSRLFALLKAAGIESAVGVLFDLGANSLHFDRPERGFSFAADGPLDMRMDPERRRTAADIVNTWDEEDLADLFYHEGGEKDSRRIAHAIVQARRRVPFLRTSALADTICSASGRRGGRIHPATRSFQALRRAVNEEAGELMHGLRVAEHILVGCGRLLVITFHSGEDGVVKRFLQERARGGFWQLVNKKPLGPGANERRTNPRARSARLRCAIRRRKAADTVDDPIVDGSHHQRGEGPQ